MQFCISQIPDPLPRFFPRQFHVISVKWLIELPAGVVLVRAALVTNIFYHVPTIFQNSIIPKRNLQKHTLRNHNLPQTFQLEFNSRDIGVIMDVPAFSHELWGSGYEREMFTTTLIVTDNSRDVWNLSDSVQSMNWVLKCFRRLRRCLFILGFSFHN